MRDTKGAEEVSADESEVLSLYWRTNAVIMAVLLLTRESCEISGVSDYV